MGNSSTIAKIINDAEGDSGASAVAVDPKNVLVSIPEIERARPVSFIANANSNTVSWSPDGTFLLFDTGQRTESNHHRRVFVIEVDP